MLEPKRALPVKIICGFIYGDENIYIKSKQILAKKIGGVDFESRRINFDFTDYYYPEMGCPLSRRFVSFKKLLPPEHLVNIKLYCLKIEKKYAKRNKRQVNIDPGYLNEAKLSLATTKDYAHRLYLGNGIYGEITLCFRRKNYKHLSTTFPDYRLPEYKDIFLKIRRIYRCQLKKKR